jgi:chaperonin GroES
MIKPTKDNILIERTESLKQIGSIHLPDNALDTPTKFKVLAVGSNVTEVKVGDSVYSIPYNGKKINDTQRIVKLDDILFVYTDEEGGETNASRI